VIHVNEFRGITRVNGSLVRFLARLGHMADALLSSPLWELEVL